ncbi:NAD-dependent epimerase/dehydratase family protein [Phyllobacterium sp. K27]
MRHGAELICPFHELDIRSPALEQAFVGTDVVFHLAAISSLAECQSDPSEAISVNVGGTANVLEMARRCGVRRVVFASTSAVYENNTRFPCKESDPVAPSLIYPMSKHQAELLCHSYKENYDLDVVITRYYNVYGPHQNMVRKSPPFVGYVIRELMAGRPPLLHANGTQQRDYVYLDDVIAINLACLERPEASGEIFNVASGRASSVNEMYRLITDLLDARIVAEFRPSSSFWDAYPSLFAGPYPLKREMVEAEVEKFTLGSTEHAASRLGWSAEIDLREGLAATIDYVKQIVEPQS